MASGANASICPNYNKHLFLPAWLPSWKTLLGIGVLLCILGLAILWQNTDCYQRGTCYSKSLPSVDNFVGREEDIRNITGYLDFTTSDVQVVHIVGPPGFGKSTLAKKVGEILVRRGIKVFYVDLGMVRDINTLSEHVMMNIVDDMKYKVSLNRVVKWVRDQYSNTLILLDNCDKLFEYSKEEFLQTVKSLKEASSRENVRYILTSQKWEADIGNFRLHAIYNLSSAAAIELLDRLAPSLTDNQKMQIADLTGNVPLALAVVGAIFKFPDAPTPEEVIEGLKENLVGTLSPAELHSKVDGSISLAYHYLTPELKELCVNLSHFPGSFDKTSAVAIFDFREYMLEMLVQRSLLQYERNIRRFHFHLLLKTFFLQVNSEETKANLQHYFNDKFLIHFAQVLHTAIPDHGMITDLYTPRGEAHSIVHMFIMLMRHKNVNTTYFAIKVLSHELRITILLRFIPPGASLFMLICLDSYSPEERDSVESFLDTYIQVVMLVAKGNLKSSSSLKLLASKIKEVDKGYKQGTLTLSTFVKYFIMLGQYYTMNGDEKNSRSCHAHILTKTKDKLQDCYPQCDYFRISVAYESVGDKVQAFHFRKLAYHHQLTTLTPMNVIKLLLLLHNDYSNTSLGNDVTEAKALSLSIMEGYPILMNAENSEYSKEVYYAAIEFFQAQNMEEHVIQLQKKIIGTVMLCDENDFFQKTYNSMYSSYAKDLFLFPAKRPTVEGTWCKYKCALVYGNCAVDAFKRQYYYLAIWSGEQSFNNSDKLGEYYDGLGCASSLIVGKSYYHIGNYSAAKMWLNHALKCFKKAHRPKYMYTSPTLSEEKMDLYYYLLMSGEGLQITIYFLIIYEIAIRCFILVPTVITIAQLGPYYIWNVFFPHQEVNLSTGTGLTEQKYNFIRSQLNTIYNSAEPWTNTLLVIPAILVIALYCYILLCLCCCCCVCTYHYGYTFRKVLYIFFVLIFILYILDEL